MITQVKAAGRIALCLLAVLILTTVNSKAQYALPPKEKAIVLRNIPYVDSPTDPGIAKTCRLDLFLPALKEGDSCPIVIWCHGGGLTGGDKSDADAFGMCLLRSGIAMASVNYRLSPSVKYPAYVEDVATAISWTQKNIVEPRLHGKIFIGGHSAGAYMSGLLAMDERYLRAKGVDPQTLGGAILLSGQVMTHFTVRAERGQDQNRIISDEASPAYYTRKETMPLLLLIGDQDWPTRLEENYYFAAALKTSGNMKYEIHTIKDRTHSSIYERLIEKNDIGFQAMISFIRKNEAVSPSQVQGKE